MTIQVAVVEDDSALRDLYVALIGGAHDMQLAWAAGSIAQAQRLLAASEPNVLLTDLGLPDGSGLELIAAAKARYPRCEVMVVSVFGDEENVVAAIEAGATGYLLKDALADWFLSTVREVHAGGSPISPSIARILLARARQSRPPAGSVGQLGPQEPGAAGVHADLVEHWAGRDGSSEREGLGEREMEILALVAKGFNFPEIGQLLAISTNTVKTHIYRMYRKLAVHSRGEAVFEAKKLGLLDF